MASFSTFFWTIPFSWSSWRHGELWYASNITDFNAPIIFSYFTLLFSYFSATVNITQSPFCYEFKIVYMWTFQISSKRYFMLTLKSVQSFFKRYFEMCPWKRTLPQTVLAKRMKLNPMWDSRWSHLKTVAAHSYLSTDPNYQQMSLSMKELSETLSTSAARTCRATTYYELWHSPCEVFISV